MDRRGAVEGLQVPGAGTPGAQLELVDSGAGTGQGRGLVCQSEHPTLILGWTSCPLRTQVPHLGFPVWETGPEPPDTALYRGQAQS